MYRSLAAAQPTISTAVTRAFASPGAYCLILAVAIVAVLGIDPLVGHGGQLALGACTWGLLILGCASLNTEQRVRIGAVVVVATIAEVLASVVWGLYVYRLDNVPAFVPPGHGMVYLGGLRLAQLALVERYQMTVRGVAIAAAVAWAAVGLASERPDVLGALGVLVLIPVFASRRLGVTFVGVFLFTALLELWGTGAGAWEWAALAPGTNVSSANPPSGVASGYVIIEAAAVITAAWLAPRLHRTERGNSEPVCESYIDRAA